MSDQDSSRKTLSIKPRAKTETTGAADEKKRVRIGARARQVAQLNRAKDLTARRSGVDSPEGESSDRRPARSERSDRFDGRGRSEGSGRSGRSDRSDRSGRSDYSNRSERPAGGAGARAGSRDGARGAQQRGGPRGESRGGPDERQHEGSRQERRPAAGQEQRQQAGSAGDRGEHRRTGSQDPRRTTRQPSARRASSKDLNPNRARSSAPQTPQIHPLHTANYDPEITGSSWDDLLEEDHKEQHDDANQTHHLAGHADHAHADRQHTNYQENQNDSDFESGYENYRGDRSHERSRHHRDEDSSDRRPRIAPQQRTSRLISDAEIFPIFAPCPMGLEEALAAELVALGYEQVRTTRAGCHFEADWWGVQRANLYSRLATRILVQLGQAPVMREDDILELAHSIEWERWFGAEHTLRVDTSAVRSPMQSLQYCNLRAKDGICDRLRDLEGARPSIDTVRPDARVHLFLSEDTATLYLDTSGESLFKRGWRLDKGEAPLRENLAAGMLALSGWDPNAALVDPFCGSGTILIEAAWIALGVPPGMTRPFGFERLRDHQARRWADLKEEAQEHILPGLEAPLVGIDINPEAIEGAQRNAERAFLAPDTIHFEVGDARDAIAPAPSGWIVTNPPYGDRLEDVDPEFWREWSANLKKEFAGWQVNAITSDHDLPKHLRLKANRRTPLFNGALDCRLFNFELVANSYRDK